MATNDSILSQENDAPTLSITSPRGKNLSPLSAEQPSSHSVATQASVGETRASSLTTPTRGRSPGRQTTFSRWLNIPIREDFLLETELLLLAFATGMQDAVSYPDYLCFASNQTGNTVFLAIGASGIVPSSIFSFDALGPNIAISLSLFVAGGWIMGQIGNYVGPRRRLWLLVSSAMQTAMVIGAVALQFARPIRVSGWEAYVVLALLAFSSGGQVAMARGVKITEITTAMATAAYVDLMIDPNLWAKENRSRNRRAAFLIMLAAGSFAGAYAHKAVNSPFALLVSAVIKVVVTVMLGFNKEMERVRSEKVETLMLG